jgi:DNA invertase Pin-like site-specific DNA recombinase
MNHLLDTVNGLGDRGVQFRSLQERIDTTTAAGTLVFHLLAALAAFDKDLLTERTKAGLATARARGRRGGRPAVMTPAKLDVARRMLADGKPKTLIAQTIGVSRPTLYQHLSRPDG